MATKRKDTKGKLLRKGESQRKDGTYMYRWTNRLGKRETIYASTLEELREEETIIFQEIVQGINRQSIVLNGQIERYLRTKKKLKKSTKANYKYYYEHIIQDSVLGKMRIKDIRKSDILLFYSDLYDDGMAPGTIKILQKIIRPALQLACDDDILSKNPADGCTKEYEENPEKKYALTLEEEQEFLDRIRNRPRMKRHYPVFAIMLKTGMRISEVVGLTWDDVDMQNRTININHQIQYRNVDGHAKFYAEVPKTSAGVRMIPMPDEVYELFREHRKIWLQTPKLPDFQVDGYSNFVFVSNKSGKCLSHNSMRRTLRAIVNMNSKRECQLPNISPHILRHTACSRLAESGCDIKVIQYLLGQIDIRTTMRVYNHVDLDRVKRELNRLEALKNKGFEDKIFTPISTPNLHQLPDKICRVM